MTEVYDKIKGHAVTESNETYRRSIVWKLRSGAATFLERMAADEIERLAKELEYTRIACERLREDRDEAANEIERLAERCADAQRLAFEWMERHDKVVGFISKNYPTVMMPNFPFPSPLRSPTRSQL